MMFSSEWTPVEIKAELNHLMDFPFTFSHATWPQTALLDHSLLISLFSRTQREREGGRERMKRDTEGQRG